MAGVGPAFIPHSDDSIEHGDRVAGLADALRWSGPKELVCSASAVADSGIDRWYLALILPSRLQHLRELAVETASTPPRSATVAGSPPVRASYADLRNSTASSSQVAMFWYPMSETQSYVLKIEDKYRLPSAVSR